MTKKNASGKRVASDDELEREEIFRRWWAINHPFDWWAKERDGDPMGHGDRLRVWALCRKAWMCSNAELRREP
jgi:hypothetical protein